MGHIPPPRHAGGPSCNRDTQETAEKEGTQHPLRTSENSDQAEEQMTQPNKGPLSQEMWTTCLRMKHCAGVYRTGVQVRCSTPLHRCQ